MTAAVTALAALALAVTPVSAPAQVEPPGTRDVRPLTVREVVEFRSLPVRSPIRVAPDGRRIAYTVEGPKRTLGASLALAADTGDVWTRVRVVDLRSGDVVELGEDGSAWSPAWSPDGSTLAYHSNRDGAPRLWLWSPSAGVRRLSDAVVWTSFLDRTPRWSPDGRRLFVKLLPEGRSLEEALRRSLPAGPRAEGKGEATVRVFRSDHGAESGAPLPEWLSWRYGGDLASIEVGTGAVTRLARGRMIAWWEVSPDGSTVAFSALEAVEDERPGYRLFTVSARGGRVRALGGEIRQAFGDAISWSPTAPRLAYVSDGGVFVADAASGEARRLTDARPRWSEGAGPVWTRDGAALVFADGDVWRVPVDGEGPARVAALPDLEVRRVLAPASRTVATTPDGWWLVGLADPETGETGFGRLDPRTGSVGAEALEPGRFGFGRRLDLTADGRVIVTTYSAARRAPDLWSLDDDLRRHRQVSALNPAFDTVALAGTRRVEWRDDSGRALEGTLLLPPGREEGARVPLVVEVYGGRDGAAALHDFDRTRQLLATHGFAVLVPDIPLEAGAPARGHVEAAVPGVDRVVDLGLADPDRIGVFGHSYGGYGTLVLLARTDRFAAGVASASHGDMAGMFGRLPLDGTSRTRWAVSGQGRMGATPWEDPTAYVENSPLFRLDRIRAPLLLLHGAEDRNTPVHLAGATFTGLRHLGRTVVLARYEGEDHWWGDWSLPNQLDYWTRVLEWFDEHL